MRAHLFTAVLLAGAAVTGTAFAGPSSAVFAYSSFDAAADPEAVMLTAQTALGSVTINATAAGNYDQTGANTPGSYLAGICGRSDSCMGDDLVRRNYFSFDVSALSTPVTAATISIYNPGANVLPGSGLPVPPGYIAAQPSLAYTLSVVSDAASAVAGGVVDAGIYYDLAYGALAGAATISPADDGMYVNITLDAAALAAINAGGMITFGGSAVPEPAAVAVLGFGLAGLGALRRRPR